MKNILVAGANSYIGTSFSDYLAQSKMGRKAGDQIRQPGHDLQTRFGDEGRNHDRRFRAGG